MRSVLLVSLLMLGFHLAQSATFTATQNGNWNVGTTWGGGCASGCVAGIDFPSANDDVFTNGHQITVNVNSACRNIFITFDVVNGLAVSNLRTLTINGTLTSWNDANQALELPTVSIYNNTVNGTITFTGSNISVDYEPFVIYAWDEQVAQFRNIIFNFGTSNSHYLAFSIRATNTIRVQSGTLLMDPDVEITNAGTLVIDQSASLQTNYPISVNILNLNGTINTSSHINSNTISVGAFGLLNSSFNGSNQTQGWWFQSSSPGSITLNSTSTINYSANATQSIWPTTYGNLIISTGGSTVTKTLSGGNLTVNGNLTINGSNTTFSTGANTVSVRGNFIDNGILTSSGNFIFDGTAAQTINGTTTTTFHLLRISNTSAPVTLNNIDIVVNSELDADPSTTFSPGDRNVTINGNMRIDGTLQAGTSESTFNFAGTTSFLGSGTRSFNNIRINGTLNAPSSLTLAGWFENNGSFNNNNGTVIFGGTGGNQLITGNNLTTFFNLTANHHIDVDANIRIANILNLGAGTTFDADGSGTGITTLLSTATRDASVAPLLSGATVSGNITVQRYLPFGSNAARVYRYLGTPVVGATVADWQAEFAITGTFTGASTGTGLSSNPSMFIFDPSTGYVAYPATSNTQTLQRGVGYSAFIRSTVPITTDLRGTLVQGSQTINGISSGGVDNGYNLIANPYASSINWDAVTKTGFNNAIYLKDNTNLSGLGNGNYVSYVGGVGVPASYNGIIASGQAFWVQSTGATSITFTESNKVSTTTQYYETPAPIFDILRISAIGNNRSDETVIRFIDGASYGVDPQWDAKKFNNDFINISTTTNNQKFTINAVGKLSCSESFILNIDNFTNGVYTLNFSSIETFTQPVSIYLFDAYLNKTVLVNEQLVYEFEVGDDESTKGSGRFTISFGLAELSGSLPVAPLKNQLCEGENAVIVIGNAQAGVEYYLQSNNQTLSDTYTGFGETLHIIVPSDLLGVNNIIQVVANRNSCEQQLILNNEVQITKLAQAEIMSVQNIESCANLAVVLEVNAANASSFRWYADANGSNPLVETSEGSLLIENLSTNLTYYVSAVNGAGCESERQLISAVIQDAPVLQAVATVEVCKNEIITLSVAPSDAAVSYKLYTTLGSSEPLKSSTDPNFEIEAIVSQTYFISAVNAGGCEGARVEASIIVAEMPIISPLAPINVCKNDDITFELNVANTSYVTWYVDAALSQEAEFSGLQPTIQNVDTDRQYFVVPYNQFGCRGEVVIAQINLTEIGLPTVAPISTCTLENLVLVAGGARAGEMYQWFKNGQFVEQTSIGKIEITQYSLGEQWAVSLINANGCTGDAEAVIIDYVNLEQAQVAGTYESCEPQSFVITVNGASSNSVYNWYESVNSQTPIQMGGNSFTTPLLNQTKSFYVAINNENNCEGPRVEVNVSVIDLEPVMITVEDDRYLVSSYASGNQWYLNGSRIEGANSQKLEPTESGYYTVLVNQSGCETSTDREWFILGLGDDLLSKVKFYPNPTSTTLTIENGGVQLNRIKIYSMKGELILDKQLNMRDSQTQVDVSSFKQGVYTLSLETDKAVKIVKFIKE